MKLTREFLEVLQQRLKVGNRRGVHLNAIPGRSRFKFDLDLLAQIDTSISEGFLNTLFSKSTFTHSINFDKIKSNELSEKEQEKIKEISRKLNNLVYQVNDIELEKGINTFGFAYPLLVRRDKKDGKVTVAPLIIWSLKISRPKKLNTWIIKKTEDDPIILNEVLINHIDSDIKVRLAEIPETFLEDGIIDENELAAIVTDVLEHTNLEVSDTQITETVDQVGDINTIPEKAIWEQRIDQQTAIHWGGIFSIFETQKQSIIKEYDHLLEMAGREIPLGEYLGNENFQFISSVETDPSQQSILSGLRNQRNMVVHGPPGTGKSQTLTAIITNALENRQRILVVCEKRTALEVLHENLKTKGLESLTILIKDAKTDRRRVVDKVRQKVDAKFPETKGAGTYSAQLMDKIRQCQQLIREINTFHQVVDQELLDGDNWTATVGKLLKQRCNEEIRPVDLAIDLSTFEFTNEEFSIFKMVLEEAEQLYTTAAPHLNGLNLNPDRMVGENSYQLEEDLHRATKKYQASCQTIKQLNDAYLAEAETFLQQKIVTIYQNVQNGINDIQQYFEKYYGNADFFNRQKTNSVFYTVQSMFSPQKKQMILDQQECMQRYKKLYDFFKVENSIDYNPRLASDISGILTETENFQKTIEQWKNNWTSILEKEMDNVQDGVSEFKVKQLESYQKLDQTYQTLIREIQKEKWFKAAIPISKDILKSVEHIEQESKQAAIFLSDQTDGFNRVYQFTNFINKKEEKHKKVIEQLKPYTNWSKTFSFYYLHQVLLKHAKVDATINEEKYQKLQSDLHDLDKYQRGAILSYWRIGQQDHVRRFNATNILKVKNLYNKRRSDKHKKLSLRLIIEKDLELFQSFFPVILTTPIMASTLFGKFYRREPFDLVLFDEASQLRVEETLPALLKGKQKIVAGDEHQMPPSNYFSKIFDGDIDDVEIEEEEMIEKIQMENAMLGTESLLEFAIDLSFDNRYLDFHYRSRHPQLIDFSNAAFYHGRLCPMPAQSDYRPIDFIQVDGTYASGTNEREALAVIKVLRKISQKESGIYPTVGIATFNIRQRNLILEKIREEAISDTTFSEKIGHLEAEGLFVKNLENIQGDERDIIILSTTYGVDEQGAFTQRFGPINQQKGYKLLNVIITRAKFKVYVCTSIPTKVYQAYKDHLLVYGNQRRAVFYAYLAYAKSVSDGNESTRQQILKALAAQDQKIETDTTAGLGSVESPFEEEVYQMLLQHYDPKNITLQYEFAGFRIDMVYRSDNPNAPLIAIECDGAKYHSSQEAYLYDLHRQRILERHGFVFYRIWSAKWWRNYQRELKTLVQFIDEKTKVVSDVVE